MKGRENDEVVETIPACKAQNLFNRKQPRLSPAWQIPI